MISAYRRILFLAFAIVSTFGQAPNEPRDQTFSLNKKYSAEISATRIDRPLLSVFSHDGDSPAHVWSKSLVRDGEDAEQFNASWDPNAFRKTVSDDGSFVLLRQHYWRSDMPVLRLISRKADKSFFAEDFMELLGDVMDNEYQVQQQGCLELVLPGERPPLFAMWHPAASRWLVLDLETLTLQSAEAAQTNHLNQVGLQRAREIARQHHPSGLQRALTAVRQRAANLISPALAASGRNPDAEGNSEAAYLFLAAMKQPEDRALIEALLDSELSLSSWSGGDFRYPGGAGGEAFATLSSRERAVAARLLDEWDGKKRGDDEGEEFQNGGSPYSAQKSTRFGSVSGRIHLPFLPPPDAGPVTLYLIPGNVPAGKLPNDDSILKLSFGGAPGPRFPGQPASPAPATLNFLFDTINPGEYRLKAVWDRRAAARTQPAERVLAPEPGDYESAESPVLKLLASQIVRDIEIFCTNRVGRVQQFAADDEAWAKAHPAEEADPTARPAPMRGSKRHMLLDAPVSDWVLRTNSNDGGVKLLKIDLSESKSDGGDRQKFFRVRVHIPGTAPRNGMSPSVLATLLDEHGCRFEASGFNNSGRFFTLEFPLFPAGAKKLALELTREDFTDENGRSYPNGARRFSLATYALTNLYHGVPENWQPDTLPTRRTLDIVSVELASFNPRSTEFPPQFYGGPRPYGYGGMQPVTRPPQNKFTFTKEAKPAPGWKKYSGKFFDRWGNQSYSLNAFCKEEEIFKYVVEVVRDPAKASFSEEEKIEVPLDRIPGAGDSIQLDLRRKLQDVPFRIFSVGGTGEFTYENGKLVSAKEEPPEDDETPQFGPPGRQINPKLRVRPAGQPNMPMGFPGAPVGPISIIAKIPHVVCRVQTPPRGTLFALVEQDTSVPEPVSLMRQNSPFYGHPAAPPLVEYWALDYRPGETNKKLTFVAQKARRAEFIVTVSKEDRRSQQ